MAWLRGGNGRDGEEERMVVVVVELTEAAGRWIDLTRLRRQCFRIRKFVPITLFAAVAMNGL